MQVTMYKAICKKCKSQQDFYFPAILKRHKNGYNVCTKCDAKLEFSDIVNKEEVDKCMDGPKGPSSEDSEWVAYSPYS